MRYLQEYLKECLQYRFLRLFIVIGEWIFNVKDKDPDPLADVWIRARFGGIELRYRIGEKPIIMFTVPNDHKDEPFDLLPVTGAKDKEGEDIPVNDLSFSEVRTDNEATVSIVDAVDADGNPTGGKAVHFGASGVAHTQYDLLYKGRVIKTFEESFNVTTGELDETTLVGGGFNFPGLTPDA